MTLEFLKPTGSYNNAITLSVNVGDLSLTETYELVLESNYSNKEITINGSTYVLPLTIIETNERYTEFAMDYTDVLGDADISGFYNYTITSTDIAHPVADSGLIKVVNDKPASLENQTKYVSPNEDGESYVMY